MGGSGIEDAASIASDDQGNIMVGGATNSIDFPTYSNGSSYIDLQLNNGISFENDAAFVKFNNNGVRLWATYFGGNSAENFYDNIQNKYDFDNQIIADRCGNFYVSFITNSNDVATVNSSCTTYYDDNLSNNQDAFLAKFSKENTLQWSTYIGGNPEAEAGLALALDNYNNLMVAGCNDTSFGLPYFIYGNAYYDNYTAYAMDAFLMYFKQPKMNAGINSSLCGGGCSGSASVLVNSSCTFGYSYQWNNGLTTQNATSLCAGNYSVIVTDTINSAIDTVNVVLSPGIQITPDVTPWSCNFACTGSASVSIPGISNATYHWSNGSVASTINGICPGSYSVTVTSAGCGNAIANFTITIPPPLYLFINSIVPPTQDCQGLCDATATVLYTGGATIPYIFWGNGTIGTTADSLCPNSTILVTAGDSLCYTTTIDVPIPSTPVFHIHHFNTTDACTCDGTAHVFVVNGSGGPLAYNWSNGQTTSSLDSLCAGSYTLIVTDPLCGADTGSFTIHGSTPIDISIYSYHTSDCPIPCSGSVQMMVDTGAVAPFTFVWSDGINIIYPNNNLCIDSTYYVTATDACGNTDTDSVTIHYNPWPYYCNISADVYSCPNVCDGVAHVQTTGGTPYYSYLWSNGSTSSVAINLCPGTLYTVTVTDICGITRQCGQVFPQASYPDLEMGQSPSCLQSCSGVAYAYLTGGIAPYNFIWNDGETTDLINDVCADSTYWVTVTDACMHQDSDFVIINIADPLYVFVDYSFEVCPLLCDGYAQVFTDGGTPPFFYTWSNGDNDDYTDNLCPDSVYSIIVFDPGCYLDTVSFVIPSAGIDVSVFSLNNSSCYSPCNASVSLNVNGGSGFFDYQWSNGLTDDALYNLCAGYYSVTVSDPGCSVDTLSLYITSPDQLIATVDSIETLICSYDCNAGAQLIITGGSPPLTYLWSDGETTINAYSLCSGNNGVTVFDPGCDGDTVNFPVIFLSDIQLLSDFSLNPTCNDTCNGSAFVSAWNGISPYTFLWDNGQTSDSAFDLCDGLHIVVVTDSLGCSVTDTLFLEEPPEIKDFPDITRSHCENPDGEIFTYASGGTSPYTYFWNTGNTEQTISNLVQGNYEITITDSFGCHQYDTITIHGLYPDLQVNNDTTILIGEYVTLSVNGASFYTWSPDYNMDCDTCDFTLASPTYTTTYCVIGIDTFGCEDDACVAITVSHECGVIFLPTAFTPNNDGHNDVFRVLGKCIFSTHMIIYNRWGQQVFESEDRHNGWDGKFNGTEAEIGVYTYQVEATNLLGEKFSRQGNVTLLR